MAATQRLVLDYLDDVAESALQPLEEAPAYAASARCMTALRRFAPPDSAYLARAEKLIREPASPMFHAEVLGHLVRALRDDYLTGGSRSVVELAHADLFDDTLDQAAALLDEGYLGPAIVLAGGMLEEHLRQLSAKHGLPTADQRGRRLQFDALATELKRAGVLSEPRRKTLVGYYGLRSHAVHNPTDAQDTRDVERAIDRLSDASINGKPVAESKAHPDKR